MAVKAKKKQAAKKPKWEPNAGEAEFKRQFRIPGGNGKAKKSTRTIAEAEIKKELEETARYFINRLGTKAKAIKFLQNYTY